MKVYTLNHGGIDFEDHTAPTRGKSVLSFLPAISIVPLVSRNGSRALPLVNPGDIVKEGQLIARGQGGDSVNIHCPVPGTVVGNYTWSITRRVLCNAMIIRMEGEFCVLGKPSSDYDDKNLSPFKLREIINDAGIVEMDGTGTPVAGSLSFSGRSNTPVSLVARLVFDDPWLVADYVLCKERLTAVAEGAVIAARAAEAQNIVVAVSAPEAELGAELLNAIKTFNIPADIVYVGSRYPQRNSHELECSLRECEKKEHRIFGTPVIITPATLAAIYDAVRCDKPVLDRYVAVGGSAIKTPRVLRARIGTRISQLFKECGGFISRPKRIAAGSPLLGRSVLPDEAITAADFAVFAVAGERQGLHKNPRLLDLRRNGRVGEKINNSYARPQPCIGCGDCRAVCPLGLDPEDIYKQFGAGKQSYNLERIALSCHGCGCCEAVCPARLPLARTISNSERKGA